MTRLALYVGASAVALAGCASSDDRPLDPESLPPEAIDQPIPPDDDSGLQIFAVHHDGHAPANARFAIKDQAFALTQGPAADPEVILHPNHGGADYFFQVFDGNGLPVSQDEQTCRRIFINANGDIEGVLEGFDLFGAPCRHKSGVDASGALTVQLMPFGDSSKIVNGNQEFFVMIALADGFVGYPANAPYASFVVGTASPMCGNGIKEPGEECDDGNAHGMDGCSAACKIEHLCCCGDGHLDPGEACDDGNNVDGDSCSADCLLTN